MSNRDAGSDPADITGLLVAHREGEEHALDELLEIVYPQLRRMAARQRRGSSEATLDATSLVHELYLRLVRDGERDIHNRVHFFALASRAMRQIAVDHARRRGRLKRGGDVVVVPLEDRDAAVVREAERLIALEQVLQRLAETNPDLPRVVECRFFGGLSVAETAEALGLSTRSVERHWSRAREELKRDLA